LYVSPPTNATFTSTQANGNNASAGANASPSTSLATARDDTSSESALQSISSNSVYPTEQTGAGFASASYSKPVYEASRNSPQPTGISIGEPGKSSPALYQGPKLSTYYAAPQASTGYAAGPMTRYEEESNHAPDGHGHANQPPDVYDYSRQAAADEIYAGESYGSDSYSRRQIFSGDSYSSQSYGVEYYSDAASYAAETYPGDQIGSEEPYGGEAYSGGGEATGVTKSPQAKNNPLEELLRQKLLLVVAVVAILQGLFVFPSIITLLGLATGLLPLAVTLFGPLVNFFLGVRGLTLCTIGPPLTVFPGLVTASLGAGRSYMPMSPLEAVPSPAEALFSSPAVNDLASQLVDMVGNAYTSFLPSMEAI